MKILHHYNLSGIDFKRREVKKEGPKDFLKEYIPFVNQKDEYKASKKLKPESGGSVEKLSADQSQIERLWKWMKERAIYNAYFGIKQDLQSL